MIRLSTWTGASVSDQGLVAGAGSAGMTDHDRLFEGSPLYASLQDVLPLIDNAFAGTQRDENCTIHQAQLADETLDREIPDEEWLVAKLAASATQAPW